MANRLAERLGLSTLRHEVAEHVAKSLINRLREGRLAAVYFGEELSTF